MLEETNPVHSHILRCMEIWCGDQSVENTVESPGIEAWISCRPFHGDARGGDVHYLSLCAGGIVTRILLADISGHGEIVADSSKNLRRLLARFMNSKSQKRLVGELNRQFTELEQTGRFATAIVATYLSHHRKLLLTNAGHPRPLLYQKTSGKWHYLNELLVDDRRPLNLPLGIDSTSKYKSSTLSIQSGDWFVMYSDAFTEVSNAEGTLLGERGLLSLVEKIPLSRTCHQFGQELLTGIAKYANHSPPNDDATLIVIRFGDSHRRPGIIERLRGYGKLIGSCFSRTSI